jgi:hypothetical protein
VKKWEMRLKFEGRCGMGEVREIVGRDWMALGWLWTGSSITSWTWVSFSRSSTTSQLSESPVDQQSTSHPTAHHLPLSQEPQSFSSTCVAPSGKFSTTCAEESNNREKLKIPSPNRLKISVEVIAKSSNNKTNIILARRELFGHVLKKMRNTTSKKIRNVRAIARTQRFAKADFELLRGESHFAVNNFNCARDDRRAKYL